MCWHQCLLVICYRILDCLLLWLYYEEVSAIIHSLVLDSLQWFYPCFYLLLLCDCQRWICINPHIIFQLRWDWSGGWGIFMHVLLGLITFVVGYGLGAWMPLWLSWGASHWSGFLMAPLFGLLLSGYPDSFLCILSQLLGYLPVVVVGINY